MSYEPNSTHFDASERRSLTAHKASIPFLITGLPRSRTAWLSVACTTSQSLCLHEPIAELPSWRDVVTLWREAPYQFIGISDSALGFQLGWLLEHVGPRTLIVERDGPDVEASLDAQAFPGSGNYCRTLLARMQPFKSHPLVKCVAFDALRDTAVVIDCMRFLMPGNEIDRRRIEALQHLNIQTDMERVRRIASERRSDVTALFGTELIQTLVGVN